MNEVVQSVTAQVSGGRIAGVSREGVCAFLGVPYAAAPLRERRFRLPEPHPGWTGERDCTSLGPNAPQVMREFPFFDMTPMVGTGWAKGDDFLNVNVWAPEGASGAPVMVFVHGGAFVAVSNRASAYDGTRFAQNGVVLMSINYRMGVEGFLPIEGAPTNLGLRDVIAALQWVRANAAAFGGDPDNVTVFGESAGAMIVADLLASPLAKGLFRRAIVQSGHGSMVRSMPVAKRLAAKVAALLGVPPTVDGFQSKSVEEALQALETVQQPTARIDLREANGREPAYGLSKFLPVWGDDVLPEKPLDALARGASAEVELLIGTNSEEMNVYLVPTGMVEKVNAPLAWFALSRVEGRPLSMLGAYGFGKKRSGEVFALTLDDLVFRLPARKFAAAHQGRTWFYEFDWRSPQCGGKLGAAHALELPFVFDTLATASGERGALGPNPPQALAARLHRLWVDFAREGRLPWAEYSAADRQVYFAERGEAAREAPLPAERHWRA